MLDPALQKCHQSHQTQLSYALQIKHDFVTADT